MFCNWVCKSWIDLSSLAMRDSTRPPSRSATALAGGRVQLAVGRIALCVDLLLQGRNGRGHPVGVVRGLLGKVLQHAEARVQRGLDALHMSSSCCTCVCNSMISFDVACAGAGAVARSRQRLPRQETIPKCVCSLHCSPMESGQLSVISCQYPAIWLCD